MRFILILSLCLFIIGCDREDTLKFIPNESPEVTVNLLLTPYPYYSGDHGYLEGVCDNSPTTGCTAYEGNPSCSFSCSGTVTVIFHNDDSCLTKSWNVPPESYQDLGHFIFQSIGDETLINIEAETILTCS